MFVNHQNYDDCKKYFQGCWIKAKECGDRVYVVSNVTPDKVFLNSIPLNDKDEDADVCIDLNVGYTIDYVIPQKTIYQFGDRATMLQRIPARMWKKGMDVKNTEFLALRDDGRWDKLELTTSIIEGFVNKPSYLTLQESNINFASGLVSAALSRRVALTNKGMVFIDNVLVAKYYEEKKLLTYKAIYKSTLEPLFPHTIFKPV